MTHPTSPTLNADDHVAFAEDAQGDGLGNSPFETIIDVVLPIRRVEIRLLLREQKGIYTAIEMRILETVFSDESDESLSNDDHADPPPPPSPKKKKKIYNTPVKLEGYESP